MNHLIIPTPLGDMTAVAEGKTLLRLDFPLTRCPPADVGPAGDSPILRAAADWVSAYFAGERPAVPDVLAPEGTAFQQTVWDLLREIPYGESVTYGALARAVSERTGRRASPRAVGQAVGRNPISLMIPCHRVLGSGGAITGYGGGLDRKRALLRLEHIPWRE